MHKSNLEISLVLPTFRERTSIRKCVIDFLQTGVLNEVIVVDNNAEPGTLGEIADLPVIIVEEREQGYGAAIKKGIASATKDYIVICEPDGTFQPEDVFKLLAYRNECDVVFGSRTVDTFIWGDANMGWFLRWGNWFVAKLLEMLFNTTYLSDVGCTFRLFSREVGDFILEQELSNSSSFGLEMQLEVVKNGSFSYVQIPVKYGPRAGSSTITGSFIKAFKLGCKMIAIIVLRRIGIRFP